MKRTSFLFSVATGTLLATSACNASFVSGIGGGGTGGTSPSTTTASASAGTAGTTGAGGSAAPEVACDPLAGKPITLGNVVGVGKDAQGTLYVDSANGVFVSGGGEVIRQHVVGSGQSLSTEYNFAFVAPGATTANANIRDLLVETTGGTADAMALGTDGKAFLDQMPPDTTMLTLVDPTTVSGMPLVNTPNVIWYVGDVANGDVILATNPMNEDFTALGGGLAIFYGPPHAVAQRTITAFDQGGDGEGTVTFLVDGAPYAMAWGFTYGAPDAGPLGALTLDGLTPQGSATLATTLRSPTPSTTPTGLSFTCLP